MSVIATPMTKKAQVDEIVRCGRDPVYFIRKYCKIQHPTRGTIPFETYPFQDACVNDFVTHRLNIVLKSRQLGLSTVCAAYATWLALFHKDKNVLVIATKLPTAMNFIKKVKVIIQSVPTWLLLTQFEPTKQAISFSNGSQIVAVPTSEDAGRSEALSLLIIDEAAWIRDFEDIWTGLAPTFSMGGNAIILSTPNGIGGQYYKLWTEAEAGQNEFNPIRLPWDVHPEHDQAWFEKETRSFGRRKVAQEFECVSGATRIVTPDGYKVASELVTGDLVFTHRGRFRPIEAVKSRLVRDDENVYNVSSPGARKCPVVITGAHPALVYRFWANNENSFDHMVKHASDIIPEWVTIDNVASRRKTTDRIINVLMPCLDPGLVSDVPLWIDVSTLLESIDVTDDTCRYPRQWGATRRFIDVDFNLGKLVGLYLAEGCSGDGWLDMGFHIDEMETHARWCADYVEALGGRVRVRPDKTKLGCRFGTANKHVRALVMKFVKGRYAHEKLLDMDEVLRCGLPFIKGLLYGHHAGDGDHSHVKKTTVSSASSRLIYQLRTLNTLFGLYPRIGRVDSKRPEHHDRWYLEFQAENVSYVDLLERGQQIKKQSRTRLINGSFVGRVTMKDAAELRDVDGGLTVYDIQVADDASFVCESLVLHNCNFNSSGDTFLQPEDLDAVAAQVINPISKEGHDRNVWVWASPVVGKTYVVSADVSRGDARDYSTFHVIDIEECEMVAEYMGKVPPEKLADMLAEWGTRYNNALLAPENNTFGYLVNTKLRDALGYKRLYYEKNTGNPYSYVSTDSNELPGFPTNQKTRVRVLSKLEELIRTKRIQVKSRRLYEQLQAFVWNGNKPMASKDSYDDLVISFAIGGWLAQSGETVNEQEREMTLAMLAANQVSKRDFSQLPGGINDAQPLVDPNIRGINAHSVYRPRAADEVTARNPYNRSISDFRWLTR